MTLFTDSTSQATPMLTILELLPETALAAMPTRAVTQVSTLLLTATIALLPATPALADKPAVARGEKVVEEWCRDCHVREGQKLTPDMAPPYSVIVAIDGRDRAWFEAFLKADHFPMTTFRLFDHEKADVVEWLMDLQRREK
ncbi:c-type cytochrome [Hoeflea sp.]|uniref:c-type cytochrome n=1 Tax=Hoeflea sp. TaxID=1940281 RepID=UPI0037486773